MLKFLSLGHQPPSNSFLREENLNKPEVYYPLDVYYCEKCGLVQLGYAVDPETLFTEYVYTTSTNNSLIKNFSDLVDNLVKRFNLDENDFAIDIGSNDGTLLKRYSKYNVRVLGVEPSSAADIAVKNGIPTVKEFFNSGIASIIAEKHGKANVITATNVFAHVKDLYSFVEGIKRLLKNEGIFVSESHHLLSLVNEMQWDSIYHEHLRMYSLKPLIHLFNRFDLDLFDAERISTHGGSIRIYVCNKGAYSKSENVDKILEDEESSGLYNKKTFLEFGKMVLQRKIEIQDALRSIKKEGKRIAGIGAPAKGSTLLNYCNITSDIMDYIAEKSNLKIGLYTPGTHIKVVEEKFLFEDQPDYAFLLSWNIADELIPKLRNSGYKGKVIVPVPSVRIFG